MTTDWDRLACALRVLKTHRKSLGGIVIRMRAGPDRFRVTESITAKFPNILRINPMTDDVHLFGGIEIAATLAKGLVVRAEGVLSRPRVIMLSMAERCTPAFAARLAQYLDSHPKALVFALDEGAEPDERVPDSLAERLAFHVDLQERAPRTMPQSDPATPDVTARCSEDHWAILAKTASDFGIGSMRAPLMAAETACILGAIEHRSMPDETDLATAAALVFSHRATQMPPEEAEPAPDTPQDQPQPKERDQGDGEEQTRLPDELVVDAVRALLPPEVLAGLGRASGGKGRGSGQKRRGNRRGRPLPARAGRLDGNKRLDIMATLRAAAPWQPMRRKQTPDRQGLLLRPSDFRVKRYETKSDRLVVFAVDASGSAAISRLNEAKGAIELLLGQAYAARDHVALVSFRGEKAELLLPPTRSLVQTKRKLSAMPGGGGTPLASGIEAALQVALLGRARGMTPVTVLVTDGKANIALDCTPDRARAREDAIRVSTLARTQGLDVLVVDSAARPQKQLRDLTQHLDGTYLPLPRADATRLSNAVGAVLDHS